MSKVLINFNKNIGRFNISVDYISSVKEIESRKHLFHYVIDHIRVISDELTIFREQIFQIHRHILHNYSYLHQLALFHNPIRLVLVQTQKFNSPDDIRMALPFIELSNYTYFSSACLCYLEGLIYVLEYFDSNISSSSDIHGMPYLSIATFTNKSQNLIVCLRA
jgi:hypothetical protein